MSIPKATSSKIIEQHRTHETDTGSPEVQVALLTERINSLTGHMKEHRHDFHSRRGLVILVGQRNRLLKYLQNSHRTRYMDLIKKLSLRK